MTTVKVSGITGTLHATSGDVELGEPDELRIAGAVLTLSWTLTAHSLDGALEAFTMHVEGLPPILRPFSPYVMPIPHGNLTLEQRVELAL